MFNTFDLLLPSLRPTVQVEIRHCQRSFGRDAGDYLFVGDVKLGRVTTARKAYVAIEQWTGAPNRGDWTVLLLGADASDAAKADDTWRAFLAAVLVVLRNHPRWRVTCESDPDQARLQRFDLTPESLVSLLDDYRTDQHYPIAFYCEFAAERTQSMP